MEPRQSCAVESAAAAHVGHDLIIIVVLLANDLNLAANNGTKQVTYLIQTDNE